MSFRKCRPSMATNADEAAKEAAKEAVKTDLAKLEIGDKVTLLDDSDAWRKYLAACPYPVSADREEWPPAKEQTFEITGVSSWQTVKTRNGKTIKKSALEYTLRNRHDETIVYPVSPEEIAGIVEGTEEPVEKVEKAADKQEEPVKEATEAAAEPVAEDANKAPKTAQKTKFSVGDLVRVNLDCRVGTEYSTLYFAEEMLEACGKVYKIDAVLTDDTFTEYKLCAANVEPGTTDYGELFPDDPLGYYYNDDMLSAASDRKMLKPDMRVKMNALASPRYCLTKAGRIGKIESFKDRTCVDVWFDTDQISDMYEQAGYGHRSSSINTFRVIPQAFDVCTAVGDGHVAVVYGTPEPVKPTKEEVEEPAVEAAKELAPERKFKVGDLVRVRLDCVVDEDEPVSSYKGGRMFFVSAMLPAIGKVYQIREVDSDGDYKLCGVTDDPEKLEADAYRGTNDPRDYYYCDAMLMPAEDVSAFKTNMAVRVNTLGNRFYTLSRTGNEGYIEKPDSAPSLDSKRRVWVKFIDSLKAEDGHITYTCSPDDPAFLQIRPECLDIVVDIAVDTGKVHVVYYEKPGDLELAKRKDSGAIEAAEAASKVTAQKVSAAKPGARTAHTAQGAAKTPAKVPTKFTIDIDDETGVSDAYTIIDHKLYHGTAHCESTDEFDPCVGAVIALLRAVGAERASKGIAEYVDSLWRKVKQA